MNYETAYNKAIEIYHHDQNLLFQRLNYFLIATAFLMAAFATVFSRAGSDPHLTQVSTIICLAGIVFSFILSVTNYLNARIIHDYGFYIVEKLENYNPQEKVPCKELPYSKIFAFVQEQMRINNIFILIGRLLRSLINIVIKPSITLDETIGDHTYIVPFLFSIIWLLLLITIFINWSHFLLKITFIHIGLSFCPIMVIIDIFNHLTS